MSSEQSFPTPEDVERFLSEHQRQKSTFSEEEIARISEELQASLRAALLQNPNFVQKAPEEFLAGPSSTPNPDDLVLFSEPGRHYRVRYNKQENSSSLQIRFLNEDGKISSVEGIGISKDEFYWSRPRIPDLGQTGEFAISDLKAAEKIRELIAEINN